MVWLQFIACVIIIFFASTRLSKYGDAIAEKTGLGQVWVGMVLLATVTSLPELVTGISSVALLGKPDLTAGDLFGSCLFNLAIIALADIIYRQGTVLHSIREGVAFSAAASAMLVSLVGVSMYVAQNISPFGILNYVSSFSIVIFGAYLFIQWLIAHFEKKQQVKLAEIEKVTSSYGHLSPRRTYAVFVISALAIIGAGIWLSFIGDEISKTTGLGAGFVGTLFLAIATSLPEVAVTIEAIRMKAVNMAISNVIGSNLFNMGIILFVDDVFYTKGPLLSNISSDHIFTSLIIVLMTCVVIMGIIYRPRRWPRAWIGIDTIALMLLYVGAFWILFILGRG